MSFLYFDPGIFVLVRWSIPSLTSLDRILWLSIITLIQLRRVVTMALKYLYRINVIKKLDLIFSSLSVRTYNNSVALGSLAICAQAHH